MGWRSALDENVAKFLFYLIDIPLRKCKAISLNERNPVMDKTNVDVWEDLVIRACKRSGNRSVDRLRGILARRAWMKREDVTLDFIMLFLAEIVEKFLPDKQTNDLCSLLMDMRPIKQWEYGTSRETKLAPFKIESGFIWNKSTQEVNKVVESTKDYLFTAITVLMSRIAHTEVRYFPGHSDPAWFRNAEKRKQIEQSLVKASIPSE